MTKDLIVIGAGTFASEIISLIQAVNKKNKCWEIIGLLDDNEELHGSHLFSKRIIGGFDWILDSEKELNVVFAIGNTKIVSKMVTRLKNKKNIHFPNVIHPSVETKHVKIGHGVTIFQGALLSAESELNNHITIGFNSVIGHHSTINNFCFIGSGVVINGCAKISEGVFFGANSTCVPSIKIGSFSTIAIGSAVISNVLEGKTMIGVPAKAIF